MFFHIKAGRRKLSEKAIFRLEQAEIEAGIALSNYQAVSNLAPANISPVRDLTPIKKVKISELEEAIEEFKRSRDAMSKGIAALEKFAERMKNG